MGGYQSREFRLETRAGEFMAVASLRGSLLVSEGKPTARSRATNARPKPSDGLKNLATV